MILVCEYCKNNFTVPNYRAKTARCCSRKCLWHITKPEREPKRLLSIKGKKAANNNQIKTFCKNCKIIFYISPSRKGKKKFCSQKCYSLYQSYIKSPQVKNRGPRYKRIYVDGKRVLEHRYIMECYLNRHLKKNEHIHHINGNKHDNRIENLMIVSPSQHTKLHAIHEF